jgi:hypothetical protein
VDCPDPWFLIPGTWFLVSDPCNGGVAQLGEHLLCKQGVVGSSPITSTDQKPEALIRNQQSEVGYQDRRHQPLRVASARVELPSDI